MNNPNTIKIDGCQVEVCDSNGEPLDQRWRDTIDRIQQRDRERHEQFLQSIERMNNHVQP